MSKVYQFTKEQVIQTDLESAWDFIRSPANLNKITPPDMTFTIISDVPDQMYEGLIIQYKIGIPFIGDQMVSEIKHIQAGIPLSMTKRIVLIDYGFTTMKLLK